MALISWHRTWRARCVATAVLVSFIAPSLPAPLLAATRDTFENVKIERNVNVSEPPLSRARLDQSTAEDAQQPARSLRDIDLDFARIGNAGSGPPNASRVTPRISGSRDLAASGVATASQGASQGAPSGGAQAPVSGGSTSGAGSAASGDAAVSSLASSLPGGGGGLGESFSTDLTTGNLSFSLPVATPAGRGGVQAGLSLSYCSNCGNGNVGMGWSIGVPAISRQSDRGTPTYIDPIGNEFRPDQDRFVLGGGTELVPICKVDGESCAAALATERMPVWANGWLYFRTRVDTSQRFYWSPDHRTWRVQAKDGSTLEFGVPLDGSKYEGALDTDPDSSQKIYRWYVVRAYDSHGDVQRSDPKPVNVSVYRYGRDGTTPILTEVFDTPPAATATTAPLNEYQNHVVLDYESRADTSFGYRAGYLQSSSVRLRRIDVTSKRFEGAVSAPRELLRRYHLRYAPTRHRSVLEGVALEGRCSSSVLETNQQRLPGTACPRLPETRLEYTAPPESSGSRLKDSLGLDFEGFATEIRELENSPPNSLSDDVTELLDVNLDGLSDVVVTRPDQKGRHQVFLNGQSSDGTPQHQGFGSSQGMSVAGIPEVDAGTLRFSNPNVAPLDVDGDGIVDLVHMTGPKRYSVFSPRVTSAGLLWEGRRIDTAGQQNAKLDFARDAKRSAVMDVNGDGLVDMVVATATRYQTFFSLGRFPGGDGQFGRGRWTGPDTADLSLEPVETCVPWSSTPALLGNSDVGVGDMNGDGLVDLIQFRAGGLKYWPGRGDGSWGTGPRGACSPGTFAENQHIAMSNMPVLPGESSAPLFNDVNGDGFADLIRVKKAEVDFYLNEGGTAWTSRYTIKGTPDVPSGSMPVRVTDINGSGTLDLVWGTARNYRYIDLTGGVKPLTLARVDNSLGKSIEFQFETSAARMMAAKQRGEPWATTMPLNVSVVRRVTVLDHLEKVGRPAGRYVTEYDYRDPVYEARQRDFRGFGKATTTLPGGTPQATQITESTFSLGECGVDPSDRCGPTDRYRDVASDALHGMPQFVETRDGRGVYHSASHQGYDLKQLYVGLDGRRIVSAVPTRAHQIAYDSFDVASFNSSGVLPLADLKPIGASSANVYQAPLRAASGFVVSKSESDFDSFNNLIEQRDYGCITGCSSADETIVTRSAFEVASTDGSGWHWLATTNEVSGSLHPGRIAQNRVEYSTHGDPLRTFGVLSGTLPLDRFHAASGAVAPAPSFASAGAAAPVEVMTGSLTVDPFGQITAARGPNGNCVSQTYDAQYQLLTVSATSYVGSRDSTGCGTTVLTSTADFDRGLGVVTQNQNAHGQPARFDYDGFGRLLAVTGVDPENPGVLASRPSTTTQYVPTTDPVQRPYSVLIVKTQDGSSPADDASHETWTFVDGLGRVLASLREADTGAGDAGNFVINGVVTYDARGHAVSQYSPYFYTGGATTFSPVLPTGVATATRALDAFGRELEERDVDGTLVASFRYHAASVDQLDPTDISGPDAGTYGTTYSDGHGRSVLSIARTRLSTGAPITEIRVRKRFLPTGEVEQLTREATGQTPVTRWLRYDTLGRLVLNVEPNTSPNFTGDINASASGLKAFRYAYDDSGNLVGTSDARGCGKNAHYDAAGRLVAVDLSPCTSAQAAYTPPNLVTGAGTETFVRYDSLDSEAATAQAPDGTSFPANASFLPGVVASISDRGQKTLFSYDARGREVAMARRVAKPGAPNADLLQRYAPRWYIKKASFDAADRPLQVSTGVALATLKGPDGQSNVSYSYTRRGLTATLQSSYGTLLASSKVDADDSLLELHFGDAAATTRVLDYDARRRVRHVMTYRGAAPIWSAPPPGYTPGSNVQTTQLLLEDTDFEYDEVNDIKAVIDHRLPSEWPAGAKPVTRRFEVNDLHRLTRVTYEYPSATDAWTSPFAAELADPTRPEQPAPHTSFNSRVLEQTYAYDWRGNITRSNDDVGAFFDRSLGEQTLGSATAGPDQLRSAGNRSLPPTGKGGALQAAYDESGNLATLIVERDGGCLPAGTSCWQRFSYDWDELGQLERARRWDLTAAERSANSSLTSSAPARAPNVTQGYRYDDGGSRVYKATSTPSSDRYTVYIFPSLELRASAWHVSLGDYEATAQTTNVNLDGIGRIAYFRDNLAAISVGRPRLLLNVQDYLGSKSVVIDHQTGELVERSTDQAYGLPDSDYRSSRWGEYRDPYGFTGKESDIEVGLTYFGFRYYSPHLGRWISPDPLTIHELGADSNPYAYVGGRAGAVVDVDGRLAPLVIVAVIAVAAAVSYGSSVVAQASAANWNWSAVQWGWGSGAGAGHGALAAGLAGGVGAAVAIVAAPLAPALLPMLGPLGAGVPGMLGGMASGGLGAGFAGGNIGAGMLMGGVSGLAGGTAGAAVAKAGAGAVGAAVVGGLAATTAGGLTQAGLTGEAPSLGDAGLSLGLGIAGSVISSKAVIAHEQTVKTQTSAGQAALAASKNAHGGPAQKPAIKATTKPPPPAKPAPKMPLLKSNEHIAMQQDAIRGCSGDLACAAQVMQAQLQQQQQARPHLRHGQENTLRFGSLNEARAAARLFAGLGDETVKYVSELGPMRGKVVGSSSPDGLRGWRIDFDPDPAKGFHVNWWDKTGGAARSSWKYGANVVSGGTEADFLNLLQHLQ